MDKFFKSRFPGIRYREHPTRKNGIRKDKYFIMRYYIAGKQKSEGIGWESEGFTEKLAHDILCEIKHNIKVGSGFFSLKEKREQEEERRAMIEREKAIEEKKNISFDDFFQTVYLVSYLSQKPHLTIVNETGLYHNYVKAVIGHKKLIDITPLDLEKIKIVMAGKAAATINHALAFVRQVFNAAKKNFVFNGENPASAVKKLKADNRRMRFLKPNEAEMLLDALRLHSEQWYEISLLSLFSGMRASEIFKLKWVDVDLDEKKIAVRDTKGHVNRYAYMTVNVFHMLKGRMLHAQFPDDFVFHRENGVGRITEVSDTFARVVDKLGLNQGITDRRQKVVFHTLRHTYASWLTQGGVNLYEVQVLMGHSNISMTQRYSHLAPDNFKKAISVLEKNTGKKD